MVLDSSRRLSLASLFVHVASHMRKRKGKNNPGTETREIRHTEHWGEGRGGARKRQQQRCFSTE